LNDALQTVVLDHSGESRVARIYCLLARLLRCRSELVALQIADLP
jgi:hypothetical protein